MNQNDLTPHETRDRVIFFLLAMTSESALQAHAPLPREKLVNELCRIWFDEIYTPGLSYIDESLKGDYSEEKVSRFEEAFDVEELVELERFHRFFELRLRMLQAKYKNAANFAKSDLWRNLARQASHLLNTLVPRANELRGLFENKLAAARNSKQNILTASDWRTYLYQ